MSPPPAARCVPGPVVEPAVVFSVTFDADPEMVAAAAASTNKSVGSSSHSPVPPLGADVSTRAPETSSRSPEVSTDPPAPDCEPARAAP